MKTYLVTIRSVIKAFDEEEAMDFFWRDIDSNPDDIEIETLEEIME